MEAEQAQVRQRMAQIKQKILVLSGKGGVGKSTVAVNLAISLSLAGKRTGLLDIDIHGPSVPKILNLEGRIPHAMAGTILPVEVGTNLKVMSIGFLLSSSDDAVIWRGPMKYQMIKQFLKDVEWGELDFLIIDSPPGTGDEPLSIIQLLENADGAVVVTTPQEVALTDVRKSITFCRSLHLPVLGVLENMSGFVCPKCGERTDIFKAGGGENMAMSMNVPFLGRIPIDPQIVEACDSGQPYVDKYPQSQAARAFSEAVTLLVGSNSECNEANSEKEISTMRIAIPLAQGQLSLHFGHCDEFAIVDVNSQEKCISGMFTEAAPVHAPGVLPQWLGQQKVNVIIAGGMGSRAQALFAQNGIQVVIGATAGSPEEVVNAYLNGTLQTGANICDH
ncbi:MAG: chromosome partitioning protein ParA [Planctomycetes bacterium RBG_13_60_9]|nr:MAG: chromosome partitioning protein ParA [Planctomycetes bacterium RBG_13_60_9]